MGNKNKSYLVIKINLRSPKKGGLSLTGFTLIELIIAVSMVGMIILAIVAVDVSSRKMLISSNEYSRLQSTVSSAMSLISKDVFNACGNITIINPTVIDIRSDDNNNWVSYKFDDTDKRIKRCLNAGSPCVSSNTWTPFAYSISNATFAKDTESGGMQIAITARNDPVLGASDSNPEVSADSVAYSRGARIK